MEAGPLSEEDFAINTHLLLAVLAAGVGASVNGAQAASPTPHAASGKRAMRLRIFFTNPHSPDYAKTCAADYFVNRAVTPTNEVAYAALRLVFAGPTTQEKEKGMSAPTALSHFYRGVSIKRGIAIVDFRDGAQKHLRVSGPACATEVALAPYTGR